MKKKAITILSVLFIATLFICGCFKTPQNPGISSSDPSEIIPDTSAIASSEQVPGTLVTEKPLIHTKKATDLRSGEYTVTEYDERGNALTEITYSRNNRVVSSKTSTYDAQNNLLTEFNEWSSGSKKYRENIYDADGNLIEVYEGDSKDNPVLDRKYIYENGLLIKEIWYEDDGSIWEYYDYEYDDAKLVVKAKKGGDDDHEYRRWTYTYDGDGNLATMSDVLYGHKTVDYYDQSGNKIREELYTTGDKLSAIYTYSYGPYGLEENWRYDSDGKEESHGKTYYDENGNDIKSVSVDKKGNETVNSRSEYDENGNLLHSETTNGFYEYTAEYNEYGYVTYSHNLCSDPTRSAGRYDDLFEYEYTYY